MISGKHEKYDVVSVTADPAVFDDASDSLLNSRNAIDLPKEYIVEKKVSKQIGRIKSSNLLYKRRLIKKAGGKD